MRWIVMVALLAAGLAGCTDETPLSTDSTLGDGVGGARLVEADAGRGNGTDRPGWAVGDWFGHHVFFGPDDTEGLHINTIVVGEEGDDWILASDDSEIAKVEAAFDAPILGPISKEDLSTSGFGGPWRIYDFPLADGKQWTGSVALAEDQVMEFSLEATYEEAIKSPAGTHAGFVIVGRNASGVPLLETNYIPEIGWYTQFKFYHPDGFAEGRYMFRVISMGHGDAWSGTYHTYTADSLLAQDQWAGPDPAAAPAPYGSFTMGDGDLYGYLYAWTHTGAATVQLVAPDGTRHEVPLFTSDPLTFASDDRFIDIPGQAGTWHIAAATAGMYAGSGAHLWEMHGATATMTGGVPDT